MIASNRRFPLIVSLALSLSLACGSSMDNERCEHCEDGFDGHDCGEDCCACLYPEDNVPCQYCDGTGLHRRCLSSAEWCAANPLPGREDVPRGTVEWYTIERSRKGETT